MMEVEHIYKEIHRKWVSCPECGKYLERGALATQCQTQNGVAKGVTAQ